MQEETAVQLIDPYVGSVFDRRFRIHERIAEGGFGAIYRANHVKSGLEVALKVLHPKHARNPAVVARFRREGDALTQLRNPHTVIAYELCETQDGTLYIVMELLHGESMLEEFQARGAMPWPRVVAIARAICDSLAEAHALGIVHRDLKPANLYLENKGDDADFIKVLDFGIARIQHGGALDASELTNAGQVIGTSDYMSPEQMVSGEIDGRSDIYTLGVVIFEMIAGRRPFGDVSPGGLLAAVLTQPAPALRTLAEVPSSLDRLVTRCLERDAQNRYANVAELAAELDAVLASGDDDTTDEKLPSNSGAEVTRIARPPRPSQSPPPMPVAPPPQPMAPLPPPFPVAPPPQPNVRAMTPQPPPVAPPVQFDAPRGSSADARPYDMARVKQRDVLVGRIVWILVLAIAAAIGVLVAMNV